MQCVEEGRLNLDAPIRTYTTTVPDANATVRQVLAMASDAAAGSTDRYDGDRFLALTPVVEACTGVSYRVALARQILDRIGMSDSVPGPQQASDVERRCDLCLRAAHDGAFGSDGGLDRRSSGPR
jgi:CubicO group peptidase (beta-lactamase class C family)